MAQHTYPDHVSGAWPDGLSDHILRTGWNGAKWETEHEAGEQPTRHRLRAPLPQTWDRLLQISEPPRCLHERAEAWKIGHAGKDQDAREIEEIEQPAGLHT